MQEFSRMHPKIVVSVCTAVASNSSQAHELSDSIFNHMFRYESAVQARRRALMLVDVLVVSGQDSAGQKMVDGSDLKIAQKV